MKKAISIISCLIGCVVLANSTPNIVKKKLTPEERAARWHAKTGGMLLSPTSKKGVVAFINMQDKFPRTQIEQVVATLRKDMDVNFQILNESPSVSYEEAFQRSKATIALLIINDSNAPTSLLAPEDRWGVLNIAKLDKGITDSKLSYIKFNSRIRKAIMRSLAMLAGGFRSQFPNNIMAVVKIEDLDAVEEFTPGDVIMKELDYLNACGVTGERWVTYKKACKQGWAPAPTNEYQKAIWDKVRSEKERGPTNPIEIPMPKKK